MFNLDWLLSPFVLYGLIKVVPIVITLYNCVTASFSGSHVRGGKVCAKCYIGCGIAGRMDGEDLNHAAHLCMCQTMIADLL